MFTEVEREAIRLTAMLAATEEWSDLYKKTPDQHVALIRGEAELQIILTRLFRDMQKKASDFVNWNNYHYQVQLDYNVDVIVNDQQIDQSDGRLIQVSLETVHKVVAAGFTAGEILSSVPIGVPSTSALIQQLSLKEVAGLVGKKVLDDGSVIDNPDSEFNVMDTVRNDIAQSIKTSLALGETTEKATARVAKVINPIERAEKIAKTESVNAYNAGVMEHGKLTGAVGKQWYDVGAKDVCARNTADGPIPINATFTGGVPRPTQHPFCRCGMRTIHQEEWDRIHA